MWHHIMLRLLVTLACIPSFVLGSMRADPRPFRNKQPDGEWVPLKFHGDEHFHYYTDANGFTVMTDENGYDVYADLNVTSGELISSGRRVGKVNPRKTGLRKRILPTREVIEKKCGEFCKEHHKIKKGNVRGGRKHDRRMAVSDGVLKNLVVLICFSDHKLSEQPPESDLDLLFNSKGQKLIRNSKNVQIAKTGSVKDVFTTSSYGNLELESTIHPWVQLDKPQSYYTNGNSGLGSRLHEAMKEALDAIDKGGLNWLDFDQDGDGIIDAITFLHSGYGAEFGGTDCNNKNDSDRIWSHKWSMRTWNSRTINNRQVAVSRYQISPAKWGTCGKSITRIGVISHEMGHNLGLEDHYDGFVGLGFANYGLMGNAWGFDASQEYPPIMSPWSKIKLGWLEPTVISKSKVYQIPSSYDNPIVYKIEEGYPEGEYLLIENRQPKGHDEKMPQGGLLIWHIDEKAMIDTEGFPEQEGWPQNGNHYRVALLQADGNYNLERGQNYGDKLDVFHGGENGVHSIGPSGTSNGKIFPNTNSYQAGNVQYTGHLISEISASGDIMTFRLSKETPSSNELMTTFRGGNGQAGNMFDVIPKSDIVIEGIDIHTSVKSLVNVEIWSKTGTWEGYDRSNAKWTYRGKKTVMGKGPGAKTNVNGFDEIYMKKGRRYALYVTLDHKEMLYSNGGSHGSVLADDHNLSILVGAGKKYPFNDTINNRGWNGAIRYRLQ